MDFNLITDEPLNYCVYAHVNKQNGKMYIGITNNPSGRWKNNGIAYKQSSKFFSSIQEYGWNCFDHIILIDNISKKMASIFECELIAKYNTAESGYNISSGSWTSCGENTSKPIYQYDFTGNFIRKWDTASEASKYYDVENITIATYKNKSYLGYQWSYDYVDKMPPYNTQHNHLYLPIYQYDVDGNFIKEWANQKDAIAQYTNTIRGCANGFHRTVYGYRWSYDKVDKLSPLPPIEYPKTHIRHKPLPERTPNSKYENSSPVCRFDLNGDLVRTYDNIALIDDVDVNFGTIYQLCTKKNENYVYRGYVWVWRKNAENIDYIQSIIESYKKIHPRIIQYDVDGNYVAIFDNMISVTQKGYIWENVSHVCRGKRSLANGYQWRYEWDTPPGKLDNYKRRIVQPIIQKTLDGEFIKKFNTASDASKEIGARDGGTNILNVCKGKAKTAYGYLWEFADQEVNKDGKLD